MFGLYTLTFVKRYLNLYSKDYINVSFFLAFINNNKSCILKTQINSSYRQRKNENSWNFWVSFDRCQWINSNVSRCTVTSKFHAVWLENSGYEQWLGLTQPVTYVTRVRHTRSDRSETFFRSFGVRRFVSSNSWYIDRIKKKKGDKEKKEKEKTKKEKRKKGQGNIRKPLCFIHCSKPYAVTL